MFAAWLHKLTYLPTSSILESKGGGCLGYPALDGDGASIDCGLEGVMPCVPEGDSCDGM